MGITAQGRALIARTKNGEQLTFTKIKIGTGVLPAGQTEASRTSLVNFLKDVPITASYLKTPEQFNIKVLFSNEGLTEAKRITEQGIYAKIGDEAEVLAYYYYIATGFIDLPVPSGDRFIKSVKEFGLKTSDTGNAQVIIDGLIVHPTIEDMNREIVRIDNALTNLENTKAVKGAPYIKNENSVKVVQGVPVGGQKNLGDGIYNGAIKIDIPNSYFNKGFLTRIKIHSFSNTNNQVTTGIDFLITGFNYELGFNHPNVKGSQQVVPLSSKPFNFPVSFCNGLTGAYILIGDGITKWQDCKVVLYDLCGDEAKEDGWNISLVDTFENLGGNYKCTFTPSLNATHLEGKSTTSSVESGKIPILNKNGELIKKSYNRKVIDIPSFKNGAADENFDIIIPCTTYRGSLKIRLMGEWSYLNCTGEFEKTFRIYADSTIINAQESSYTSLESEMSENFAILDAVLKNEELHIRVAKLIPTVNIASGKVILEGEGGNVQDIDNAYTSEVYIESVYGILFPKLQTKGRNILIDTGDQEIKGTISIVRANSGAEGQGEVPLYMECTNPNGAVYTEKKIANTALWLHDIFRNPLKTFRIGFFGEWLYKFFNTTDKKIAFLIDMVNGGFQSFGNSKVQKSSTTAFQVNNDSDVQVVGVDTTNQELTGSAVSEEITPKKVVKRNSNGNIEGECVIGEVKYISHNTIPTGYLKANGAAVSRNTYAKLFAFLGVNYGVGDGINTFNLPDLRGVVARGLDDSRGLDVGRVLGSYQADENKLHGHTASSGNAGLHGHTYTAPSGNIRSSGNDAWTINTSVSATTSLDGLHNHPITVDANGGTEVRMKNIALLAIIKY